MSIEVVGKTCRRIRLNSSYPISLNEGNLEIKDIDLTWKIGEVINPDTPPIKSIQRDAIKKDEFIVTFYDVNKTMTFILPLYFKTKKSIKYDEFVLWAAIDNKLEYLCVAINMSNTEDYFNLERLLCKHELFESQEVYNEFTMLFKFKITDSDVLKLIEGKYSEIQDKNKLRIVEFHEFKQPKNSLVYGVLYKSNTRKKEINLSLGIEVDDSTELLGKFESNEPDDLDLDTKDKFLLYKDII